MEKTFTEIESNHCIKTQSTNLKILISIKASIAHCFTYFKEVIYLKTYD